MSTRSSARAIRVRARRQRSVEPVWDDPRTTMEADEPGRSPSTGGSPTRVEGVVATVSPVVDEGRLQTRHRRSLDGEMGVAPLRRIPGIARPFLGDANPAAESDPTVADEHLAMRAMVRLRRARDPSVDDGTEGSDIASTRRHPFDEPAVDLAGADRVEQDADAAAPLRRSRERVGEPVGDRARPVDERDEVDRLVGRVDGLEHGREDLNPVAEDLDLVAVGRRDTEDRVQTLAPAVDAIVVEDPLRRWWIVAGRSCGHASEVPGRAARQTADEEVRRRGRRTIRSSTSPGNSLGGPR